MKTKPITSIKDPAFEELRRSRTILGRQQENSFPIEGKEMIRQALQAGFSLKALYCIDPKMAEFWEGTPFIVPPGMMTKVYSHETPEVVALAFKKETQIQSLAGKSFFLVLDRVQNCHNIGMILRSAEAFGVEGVILVPHPTADLYDRNCLKGSMGSFFRLPICQQTEQDALAFLKKNKIKLISTAMEASLTLDALPKQFPVALIVGNETSGISQAFIKESDKVISIPMKGQIQSLNVVVATSLCLYHLSKT